MKMPSTSSSVKAHLFSTNLKGLENDIEWLALKLKVYGDHGWKQMGYDSYNPYADNRSFLVHCNHFVDHAHDVMISHGKLETSTSYFLFIELKALCLHVMAFLFIFLVVMVINYQPYLCNAMTELIIGVKHCLQV